MKPLLLQITLAFAVAMPLVSSAQDNNLSKKLDACLKTADGVTMEMIDCMGEESKRQDVRLNKAYKTLMVKQNAARKKELQETQRVWIKFRDLNCTFYHDPDGGTMARINASDCEMSMTADRAKELENLAQ